MNYSWQTIHPNERDSVEYEGVVKIRLGHSKYGSIILPDKLFINFDGIGLRFLQPKSFLPNIINLTPYSEVIEFVMDVCTPKDKNAYPATISFGREELVERDDATCAFYYKCKIKSHRKLHENSSGAAVKIANGGYKLTLYHFTSLENSKKILNSCELWMSNWNLAGTNETTNVKHAYLTSIQSIEKESDLQLIAMSSKGEMLLGTTPPGGMLTFKVHRRNTNENNTKIKIRVSDRLISPQPIYFHPYYENNPAYYEVVSSEIFRCAGEPDSNLELKKNKNSDFEVISFKEGKEKFFEYVICGDTSNPKGLQAPFDEEPNESKIHFEKIGNKSDIFKFWKDNQNSDQVSNKNPILVELK